MTTEKRLMIDPKSVQDSYTNLEIDDLAYIISEHNDMDALIKVKINSKLMQNTTKI